MSNDHGDACGWGATFLFTYEVSHLISDSAGCSNEGVITLVVLHLHLKEP